MAEPISVQTLLTYLTLISVPVGVFYHIMTLNNTSKNQRQTLDTRQTNILMNLYKEWGTDEYQNASWTVLKLEYESRKDFEEKYGTISELTEVTRDIFKVLWFYNGLGVLVHRGLADLEKVNDLFGYIIVWMWEQVEPFVQWEREEFNQPDSMEWFEALYKQIKPLRE
jgi:hypothetical protein